MTYRSKSHRVTIIIILLTGMILLQSQSVSAHAPASIDLFYDYGNQRLFVTIGHNVINNLTHYISQINITVNGEHYLTANYVGQEEKAGMTDDFAVTAVGGDIIGVTAYCSVEGSIHDEVTVVATEPITETSPTNTGLTDTRSNSTDGNNAVPLELIIIAAVGSVLVILIAITLVRLRS
jgi:hypothetical protein